MLQMTLKGEVEQKETLEELELENFHIQFRKVDGDVERILATEQDNFLYATGKDLVLKLYEKPKTEYSTSVYDMQLKDPFREILVCDSEVLQMRMEGELIFATEEGEVVFFNLPS